MPTTRAPKPAAEESTHRGPPLVADADGALPLPWLDAPLSDALQRQRGHALLVEGAWGVGVLPYALTLAQALLCEDPEAQPSRLGPCGRCGSCALVRARLHPDLLVLMSEADRVALGWPLVDDKPTGDDSKRKPSRQIRIDEVRALIDWSTKTTARGRGKVAVVHPADALNVQSANALLKTLEEPHPGTRLLLTTADADRLLPTVRSRCQRQALPPPAPAEAEAWLAAQGVADAAVLLAACSGRPLEALAMAEQGMEAAQWAQLPVALARGQGGALQGWGVPRTVDALQKLCHDALAVAAGGEPRFFPAAAWPPKLRQALGGRLPGLAAWSRDLSQVARHAEHPWNEGLLVERLGQGAWRALAGRVG